MNTITINAKLLKAAQQFQGKNDVRHYLNGICISNDGNIKASNGHILFRAPHGYGQQLGGDIIIDIKGAVPASAYTAIIDLDQKTVSYDDKAGTLKRFDYIDGIYPDIDRIIPASVPKPVKEMAIAGELLATTAKAMNMLHGDKTRGAIYEFHGADEAIVVRSLSADHPDAIAVLMPMRLKASRHEMHVAMGEASRRAADIAA